MKTIIKASAKPLSWCFIPDSALVNAGKPFFIPEFADEFEAILVAVVRISRIGKSIGARFAERYYSEIAPGIHFRSPKLFHSLMDAGLPPDPSYSFDRSLTVGSFIEAKDLFEEAPLEMELVKPDGCVEKVSLPSPDTWQSSISEFLEAVSNSNTVKMGDFLIPLLTKPLKISIGDTLHVRRGEEILLTIHIK